MIGLEVAEGSVKIMDSLKTEIKMLWAIRKYKISFPVRILHTKCNIISAKMYKYNDSMYPISIKR